MAVVGELRSVDFPLLVLHVLDRDAASVEFVEEHGVTRQGFKASEIGRDFGFRTLPKQFETGNAQKPIIQSSMIPTKDSTPIVQVTGSVLDSAESLLSEVVEVTTLQTHGADYAEIAWQRRLRNQAVKKKKRGRGI